jgi:hypothetical protein
MNWRIATAVGSRQLGCKRPGKRAGPAEGHSVKPSSIATTSEDARRIAANIVEAARLAAQGLSGGLDKKKGPRQLWAALQV